MPDDIAEQLPTTEEGAPLEQPEQPGRAFVYDTYGRRFSLPAEQASRALAQGFRPETDKERAERLTQAEFGDRPIAAGAASAARTLSLGLSDAGLTKTGLVKPRTLEGLEAANPEADATGTALGLGAGLFTGADEVSALGLVGKAGSAVAKGVAKELGGTVAAKIAGHAIGAALEGGFYGAGSALDESVLGDTQLTGEKLLSSIGLNAALAIGGGAVGEALGAGVRKLAPKVEEALANAPAKVAKEANERALRVGMATTWDLRKIPEQKQQQIGADLLKILKPWDNAEDIYNKVTAAKQAAGEKMGSILEHVDKSAQEPTFDMTAVLQRAKDEILEPLKANPIKQDQATWIRTWMDRLSKRGNTTFADANDIKNTISEGLYNTTTPDIQKRLERDFRGILSEEIDKQIEQVAGPELLGEWQGAKRLYGSYAQYEPIAERGVSRIRGNRTFSLSDHLTAAASGQIFGPLTGFATALGNKFARERGPSAVAKGLEALSKSPMFDEVAKAFSGFVKKVNASAPEVLGQYAPILSNALARSPDDLLMTHMVLSQQDPKYRDAMSSAGLRYDQPGGQVDQRAAGLATLRAHLAGRDADVTKQMSAFLAGRGLSAPGSAGALKNPLDEDGKAHRDRLQAFQARAAELEQLATNPDALTERIGAAIGPLQHTAPTTAQAMAATATQAVGFLASKLPKPPVSAMPGVPALASEWKPSDADVARFERYMAAVNDPTSVFADLRHGTVTKEAVEALQAVYPSYYADMRQTALDQLTGHGKPLEYRQRLALGSFLGMALTPSAAPQAIAQIQQMHQAAPAKPAPHSSAQIKPPPSMTDSQRLEAGIRRG